jgi:hypothetical protein
MYEFLRSRTAHHQLIASLLGARSCKDQLADALIVAILLHTQATTPELSFSKNHLDLASDAILISVNSSPFGPVRGPVRIGLLFHCHESLAKREEAFHDARGAEHALFCATSPTIDML